MHHKTAFGFGRSICSNIMETVSFNTIIVAPPQYNTKIMYYLLQFSTTHRMRFMTRLQLSASKSARQGDAKSSWTKIIFFMVWSSSICAPFVVVCIHPNAHFV